MKATKEKLRKAIAAALEFGAMYPIGVEEKQRLAHAYALNGLGVSNAWRKRKADAAT